MLRYELGVSNHDHGREAELVHSSSLAFTVGNLATPNVGRNALDIIEPRGMS